MMNQIIAISNFFVQQNQFLGWLSQYHTVVLDIFFIAVTFLGSEYFYMLLVPFLFGYIDRKNACVIVSVILISLILNTIVKVIFSLPRPPESLMVPLYSGFAEGYGFPSGHAQGSLTLWGLIAIRSRNRIWVTASCIAIVLMISFSRLYLGVHYPIDIIGGWGFAVIVLLIYLCFEKFKLYIPYWILCILFLIFSLTFPIYRIEKTCAVLAGIYFGMFLGKKFDLAGFSNFNPAFRISGLILTSAALFFIHKISGFPYAVSYTVIGSWISFFYPAVIVLIADKYKI